MTTPGKQILVTGGTGFIGSYVIRDLIQKGYRVTALRRRKQTPAYINEPVFDSVQWFEGDILDTDLLDEAMTGTDAVIHAAALVSFGASRAELLEVNVEGTANVVNAAIDHNIKRFVHVSSVAAFGKSHNTIITERQTWQPGRQNTHYAISKQGGEMEVWRGIAEGLNAVIVNPSTVLGYGDWTRSSSALFKNAYQGFPWYTNGSNGFVDVEDVSRATVLLMELGIQAERFILNGENWTYRHLLNALADGFGKRRPRFLATPFLAGVAWRAEKLKSMFTREKPLITRESAKVAGGYTQFDNSKILSALPGFSFRPLQETISAACKKYLEHATV